MVSTSDGVFRDERERQGIDEDIPEPVRRGLHRQIGRLLLERGGSGRSRLRPDRPPAAGLNAYLEDHPAFLGVVMSRGLGA